MIEYAGDTPTLVEIRKIIDRLSMKINASESIPLYFDEHVDFGHPYIEIIHNDLCYVVKERGVELERKTTQDLNELLFWTFEGLTFGMAVQYELESRIEKQDCRRIIFEKQLELLDCLDPSWKSRVESKNQDILSKHPFDDLGSIRAIFCKELRDQGYSSEKAWETACDRYPLPDEST